jgi:hypothetical protein
MKTTPAILDPTAVRLRSAEGGDILQYHAAILAPPVDRPVTDLCITVRSAIHNASQVSESSSMVDSIGYLSHRHSLLQP